MNQINIDIKLLVISYAVIILWGVFLTILHKNNFLTKENFKGKKIFISYGLIAYPAAVLGMIILYSAGNTSLQSLLNYSVILSLMWLGGSIDDMFGNRQVGGFRGHINSLLKNKKITTGLIKILFGISAGAFAAYFFNSGSVIKGAAAFLIVPLSANTINLFDTRPGRAFSVYFLCSVVIVLCCGRQLFDWNICGILFAVSIIAYYWDRIGDAMMGDSFSNVLGSFLGILLIMNMPLWFVWICIILNISLQALSEKYSFHKIIENNTLLKRIDRCTGIRK